MLSRAEIVREAIVFVALNPYSPVMKRGCLRALRELKKDPMRLDVTPWCAEECDARWHNSIGGRLGDLYVRFSVDRLYERVTGVRDVWLTQYVDEEDFYFHELEKGA